MSERSLRRATTGGRRAPAGARGPEGWWPTGEERAKRRALFDALAPGGDRLGWPGADLVPVLARALDLLEHAPLASAGLFPGDLVRRLMDLPPIAWFGEPALYERYQAVVRAAALARRRAPEQVEQAFWRELPARLPGEEGS